jgi:DNA mismatch repair protein MutS
MMRQFAAAKQSQPDALVFFRMGDFFELFGVDALVAAHVCGLTLTSRDKGAEDPVPMAGVPVVSIKASLKKSLEAGFKVALCDQVEDPRDAKALVRREIVRVLTPAVSGDLFDEEDAPVGGSFLVALAHVTGGGGASVVPLIQGPGSGLASDDPEPMWTMAAVDAATGDMRIMGGVGRLSRDEEILRLDPREILLPQARTAREGREIHLVFAHQGGRVPALVPLAQDPLGFGAGARVSDPLSVEKAVETEIARVYGGPNSADQLDGVLESLQHIPGAAEVLAILIHHVRAMQRTERLNWKLPVVVKRDDLLLLDAATRRHLDLLPQQALGGSGTSSFFSFLNICVTLPGARRLYDRLAAPFARLSDVESALSITDAFYQAGSPCVRPLRALLSQCSDLDRITARLFLSGGAPRDVLALRRTLLAARGVAELLLATAQRCQRPELAALVDHPLFAVSNGVDQTTALACKARDLVARLDAALADEAEGVLGKGVFFRAGFDPRLDECRRLAGGAEAELAQLLERERQRSGLSTLKIGFNRVFGYYLEVSRGRADKVPDDYVRRQTLANAERYVTAELKQLEESVLHAEERLGSIERELFALLVQDILSERDALAVVNDRLARIDLHAALAKKADDEQWTRPTITENAASSFHGLVHPVLAAAAHQGSAAMGAGRFVPNDVTLGVPKENPTVADCCQEILLITGPNMAGKSTIMRQVALAHIMAQMGSFVPARQATVGLCDQIFTRIGSGDDVRSARSTFMVEMAETAQILRQATPRSLILMDEIGRGTSTWDGLALAWAILEEMDAVVGGRTMFSTHYHELVQLCDRLRSITPMQVEVIDNPEASDPLERVLFTHRFVPGAATESYGIHVARMAGLPEGLTARAAAHLGVLSQRSILVDPVGTSEQGLQELREKREPASMQPARQGAAAHERPSDGQEGWLDELRALDLGNMTPLQALNLLSQWQSRVGPMPGASQSARNRRRGSLERRGTLELDPLF